MSVLLTLDEAKAALRLRDTDSERDELLVDYVDAVTTVVESRVGWVSTRTLTLEIRQSGTEVALAGLNVISLTSGAYVDGGAAVTVTGMAVGAGGVLRMKNGGSLPAKPWNLTLKVGMDPIPSAVKRGAAEILIEAWKSQRSKPGEVPDMAPYLIPYRAAAWFAGYERRTGFA